MSESMDIFKPELLAGKTVFVTGGASGIGLGIVDRFAAAGANLVIASRRQEKCEIVAKDLRKKYGIKTLGLGLDVRESAKVNEAFKKAHTEMGGPHILINNAAGNFYWPAEKMRDKLWHAVINIDLNGTFYCSRAAFKYMKEAGEGCIISTTMTLHKNGWPGMAHATAAKAGIDALTQTLALEWARYNIRVNAVAPGPILTEGVAEAFKAGGNFEEFIQTIPLGRQGKVEEIGNMMVFLASPAATWITGAIFTEDGGEGLSPRRASITPERLEKLIAARKENRGS